MLLIWYILNQDMRKNDLPTFLQSDCQVFSYACIVLITLLYIDSEEVVK